MVPALTKFNAWLYVSFPLLLDDMILTETLFPHLWEIDETAHRRVEQIMTELLEKNPAPDKSTQQLDNLSIRGITEFRLNRRVTLSEGKLGILEPEK